MTAGGEEPNDVRPGAQPGLFARVPGQAAAVRALRAAAVHPVHAYLLVGPSGSGKRAAARAFAAALLCPGGGDGTCRDCRLALAETHPDLHVFERVGASITVSQAQEMTRVANLYPVERPRQVLIATDLDLVREAAPALLKTVEEPPPSTVFVLLASAVPPELVTIASRCVVVEFAPLSVGDLVTALVARGVDPERATVAAASAGGRLDRAELLADDAGFAARQALWRSVPQRLDGTGATVAVLVDELLSATDTVLGPLQRRQALELEELEERSRIVSGRPGTRPGRRDLEERHKRQLRRARTDELKAGLATLAGAYRDRVVDGRAAVSVFAALRSATEAIVRNPNEQLLLQALLLRLEATP
jgi:DNA polymerase-3 subunit delta'